MVYGTSITQGGCASLPGSDFVSTVGRMLDVDVQNFGFSGNGWGDIEVARLLSEIDAAMFVLDYCANVSVQRLRRSLPPFYRTLRARRPHTPIALLSNVMPWGIVYNPATRSALEGKRDVMIHFYSKTRRAGDANLHFIDGSAILPVSADAAYVDGVHPTDHGFQLMAERLAPSIRMILFPD